MRALVRSLFLAGLPGDAEIPGDRWYGSGSLSGTPERPFVEIRFGGTTPGLANLHRRRLEVWVHDDEGSYDRIETWIKYIKNVLDASEHASDGSGNEIVKAEWRSDSTDLYDDGYRTNCMMTAYDIIGKEST